MGRLRSVEPKILVKVKSGIEADIVLTFANQNRVQNVSQSEIGEKRRKARLKTRQGGGT